MIFDSATACLVALAVSAVVAFPVYRVLLALNSRQNVSRHLPEHQTKQGTPTMGGIVALLGIAAGLLCVDPRPWPALWLLAGFCLIGFLDDFILPRYTKATRGLSWGPKLLLQLAFSIAILRVDPSLGSAGSAVLGVSVLIVLFVANAYNFADGLDCLAGSLGIVIALGLGVSSLLMGYSDSIIVGAAIAGGLAPYLVLNAPPARVFMGDVGALPIGALIGYMAAQASTGLIVDPKHLAPWLWVIAPNLVVLAAELLPVPIQIASVKLLGRKVFLRTPIHHGFEARGWPESRIVWTFAAIQVALSLLAVSMAAAVAAGDKGRLVSWPQ